MGGEKGNPVRRDVFTTGSPPHGRGKGRLRAARSAAAGITPAWAGKSALRQRLPVAVEDHPRMGGEKVGNNSQFGPG